MEYKIVAVDDIDETIYDEGMAKYFHRYYVATKYNYYVFSYNDELKLEAQKMTFNVKYPLGNWIMGIRDPEELDLINCKEYVDYIEDFFSRK